MALTTQDLPCLYDLKRRYLSTGVLEQLTTADRSETRRFATFKELNDAIDEIEKTAHRRGMILRTKHDRGLR